MKGLLIKDMHLLLHQKMTVFVIVLLGIFTAVTGGNASFSLGYMMMVSAMLVVITISYDYMEKGMAFLLALPVSRKQYVLEKYVLAVLVELIVVGFAVFIQIGSCLFGQQVSWDEFLVTGAVMLVVSMLFLAGYIMVYIKWGPEKSNVAFFIVVGVVALAAYLGSRVGALQKVLEKLIVVLSGMSMAQLVGTGILLWAVFMAGAVVISMRIMEKKEF